LADYFIAWFIEIENFQPSSCGEMQSDANMKLQKDVDYPNIKNHCCPNKRNAANRKHKANR